LISFGEKYEKRREKGGIWKRKRKKGKKRVKWVK
jgi:hypothetical protein